MFGRLVGHTGASGVAAGAAGAGEVGRGGLAQEALRGWQVGVLHSQVHRAAGLSRHRVDDLRQLVARDVVREAVHWDTATTVALKRGQRSQASFLSAAVPQMAQPLHSEGCKVIAGPQVGEGIG